MSSSKTETQQDNMKANQAGSRCYHHITQTDTLARINTFKSSVAVPAIPLTGQYKRGQGFRGFIPTFCCCSQADKWIIVVRIPWPIYKAKRSTQFQPKQKSGHSLCRPNSFKQTNCVKQKNNVLVFWWGKFKSQITRRRISEEEEEEKKGTEDSRKQTWRNSW
jgi:hypothetical protein